MQLSEIWRYPIKSCGGVSVTEAELDSFGLKGDRRWMLVDGDGMMVTQRECPRMCLIQVEELFDPLAPGLLVDAPGFPPLNIQQPKGRQNIAVQVWQDRQQAWLVEDPKVHQWFSDFLSKSVRLVWWPEFEQRQVDLNYARTGDQVAFADGFPFLLISQASLDDLNSRLSDSVSMTRFRPNLVISGSDMLAEEQYCLLTLGRWSFELVKPCARCSIPSIDPQTGQRQSEPTRTLASYRKQKGEIFFGQNLIYSAPSRQQLLSSNHSAARLSTGMPAFWQ